MSKNAVILHTKCVEIRYKVWYIKNIKIRKFIISKNFIPYSYTRDVIL